MQTAMTPQNRYIGFPFYAFITLLVGGVALTTAVLTWQMGNATVAALALLFFAAHLGLYWLNLKQFQDRRWWIFYYAAQSALIIILAMLPYGVAGSATIAATLCITQVGEALGLWGNTWRSFWLGAFYFGLLMLLLTQLVAGDQLFMSLSNVVVNGGFIVLLMVIFNQQLAERQKAEELAETLESANAQLAAYAARNAALTLQAERQRMARELHDTLAQGVAGLVLQLEAVKAHLAADRSARAAEIIEQALGRARSTLAASRAAIDDLRAATIDLNAAVREQAARFTQATGIPSALDLAAADAAAVADVTGDMRDHLLRILDEALANVARHAQATQVTVRLHTHDNQLTLEVCDNGQGFDATQLPATGHYGLLGMRERARLSAGTLTVASAAGEGTCVRFVAPASAEARV
jgi:NarL family two-component system sensor histidine kinase YdfH